MSTRDEQSPQAGAGSSEILEVVSGLPFVRAGVLRNLWTGLQARGMLQLAGLSDFPVRLGLIKFSEILAHRSVLKVSLVGAGWPAAGMSAISWDDALRKAVGEYCEVLAWASSEKKRGETRSGWAAAISLKLAARSAYAELVERDSLVTHFLCSEVESVPIQGPRDCCIDASFAQLWSSDPEVVVVLAGWRPTPAEPWFLGAGAGSDLEIARLKAYLEMVMILSGYRYANKDSVPMQSRHYLAIEHIHSSLGPAMDSALRGIFLGSGGVRPAFRSDQASMAIKYTKKFGKLLFVAHGESGELCSLSWGESWEASRPHCEALLRARGLQPRWQSHPFA
jgi:hypothetical protein